MAELYESRHTGAEIDDAVGRAKVGGEIDAILNAEEYSSAQTYALGDYCKYTGKLYRCTTAIIEAEAWTEAHWTETSVTAELKAVHMTLQNKADTSSVYSKEESISASTRTALNLPETATPDAALAEIARQLSESDGLSIELLWENAAPNSSFGDSTVQISNIALYEVVLVEFKDNSGIVPSNTTSFIVTNNFKSTAIGFNVYARMRFFSRNSNGVSFYPAYKYENNIEKEDNSQLVPVRIYGIKGVTNNV